MTDLTMADLRLIRNRAGDAISMTTAYRTMFPFDAFVDAIACPNCGCTKSGHIDEANTLHGDACDPKAGSVATIDGRCLCHDEEACPRCRHNTYEDHDERTGVCNAAGCGCGLSESELRYAYGDR